MDAFHYFSDCCGVADYGGCFFPDVSRIRRSLLHPHNLAHPDRGHLRGSPEGVQAGQAAGGDRGRQQDPRLR